MLAWERAPALPISHWFNPPLSLPHPDTLDSATLHGLLWQTIRQLHCERIVLECTDHLSDRELYTMLFRDILPSCEKKVDCQRTICTGDAWMTPMTKPGFAIMRVQSSGDVGKKRPAKRLHQVSCRRIRVKCLRVAEPMLALSSNGALVQFLAACPRRRSCRLGLPRRAPGR